jgi:hypothetical protein
MDPEDFKRELLTQFHTGYRLGVNRRALRLNTLLVRIYPPATNDLAPYTWEPFLPFPLADIQSGRIAGFSQRARTLGDQAGYLLHELARYLSYGEDMLHHGADEALPCVFWGPWEFDTTFDVDAEQLKLQIRLRDSGLMLLSAWEPLRH